MAFALRMFGAGRLPMLAAVALAAGCSSEVIVESHFPSPLVEPLPVSVGVIFDKELYNYIYTEDIPDQSTWTIALGDANVAMLRPLFDKMFRETRMVAAVPVAAPDAANLDGVIWPKLDKFEFDVPVNEKNKFVEVWIQYQIRLYEPNGNTVVEWPVSGYGKAQLGRNREDAVQKAAIVAMREVGANIATKFAQQPQVSEWLGERQHGTTTSAEPAPAATNAGQASN